MLFLARPFDVFSKYCFELIILVVKFVDGVVEENAKICIKSENSEK